MRDVVRARFSSVRKFGVVVRVGTGTTSRWFGRAASLPDAPALYRLVTKTGISIDWLMTGTGPRMHEPGDPAHELDHVCEPT